jgi:hypothetical protein
MLWYVVVVAPSVFGVWGLFCRYYRVVMFMLLSLFVHYSTMNLRQLSGCGVFFLGLDLAWLDFVNRIVTI